MTGGERIRRCAWTAPIAVALAVAGCAGPYDGGGPRATHGDYYRYPYGYGTTAYDTYYYCDPHYEYYYYPRADVYFHISSGYYFYHDHGYWRRARALPPYIRLTLADRRRVFITDPRPYRHTRLYTCDPRYEYYYYPGANVYFHIVTGFWFWFDHHDHHWRRGRDLPKYWRDRLHRRHRLYITDPEPYEHNDRHRGDREGGADETPPPPPDETAEPTMPPGPPYGRGRTESPPQVRPEPPGRAIGRRPERPPPQIQPRRETTPPPQGRAVGQRPERRLPHVETRPAAPAPQGRAVGHTQERTAPRTEPRPAPTPHGRAVGRQSEPRPAPPRQPPAVGRERAAPPTPQPQGRAVGREAPRPEPGSRGKGRILWPEEEEEWRRDR